MENKPNNKSLHLDLLITYFSQFVIIISQVLLVKLFIKFLSTEEFGVYIVVKRFISSMWPLLTINLGISLSKYISANTNNRKKYLFISLVVVTLVFLLYFTLSLVFKNHFSYFLFSTVEYSKIIIPFSIFFYANILQNLINSYFRGTRRFLLMNMTKMGFWLFQVLILLILYIVIKDPYQILVKFFIYFSLSFFSTYLIVLLYNFKFLELNLNISNIRKLFQNNKPFLKFGINRIPTEFFMASIFFLPVFYASNFLSLSAAAFLGCIITFIRIFQLIGIPFNQILLPVFSFQKSINNDKIIFKNTNKLIDFIFTFPLLLTTYALFISEEIVILWFGNDFNSIIPLINLISPSIVLLLAFTFIRGVLNGLYEFPYLNLISFYSFCFLIAILIITHIYSLELLGISLAFGVATSSLGIFSIYYLAKNQIIKVFKIKNILSFLWAIIIVVGFITINEILLFNNILMSLLIKSIILLLVSLLSFYIYWLLKYSWVLDLISKIKTKLKVRG